VIIGFGHIARVGKTTAADIIATNYGYEVRSFAGPLKAWAYQTNPIVLQGQVAGNVGVGKGRLQHQVQSCGGWDGAKKATAEGREVREFLQRAGVAAREVFGEDFWVKTLLDNIRPCDDAVIDDVRFPNECAAIHKQGGLVVRVTRPNYHPLNDHESETALLDYDGWDYELKNDGTLQDLEKKVTKMMKDLGLD